MCFNQLWTQTAQLELGVSSVFFARPVQQMEIQANTCNAFDFFDNKHFNNINRHCCWCQNLLCLNIIAYCLL